MDGNETDKIPTVHIVKEALDKKADLIGGKIPKRQLPDEISGAGSGSGSTSNVNLTAGNGIIVDTDSKTGRMYIRMAPSKETVMNDVTTAKKGALSASLHYKDICYADNMKLFIAIAEDSDKVITSSTCKSWNTVTLPASLKYTSIAYSSKMNKTCIVATNSNQVMLSDNGTSFTSRVLSSGTMDLVKVIAIDSIGSGVFVALDITNNKMVTSTDGGITWNEQSISAPVTAGAKYTSMVYSTTDKKIVMVGTKGTIMESDVITSDNISSLVFTNRSLTDTTVDLSDVCYSKDYDIYCATISNDSNNVVVFAPDELKWSMVSMGNEVVKSNWIKIQYMPFYKMFMMISGSEDRAAVSFDGILWQNVVLPDTGANGKYSSMAYACNDLIIGMCLTVDGINQIVVIGINPFP